MLTKKEGIFTKSEISGARVRHKFLGKLYQELWKPKGFHKIIYYLGNYQKKKKNLISYTNFKIPLFPTILDKMPQYLIIKTKSHKDMHNYFQLMRTKKKVGNHTQAKSYSKSWKKESNMRDLSLESSTQKCSIWKMLLSTVTELLVRIIFLSKTDQFYSKKKKNR